MHFLCLHGGGTNNQVFESQTASLRYELGDNHTYEFVEGTITWPMAPDIASLSQPDGEYFSYFDPHSPESAQNALLELDKYVLAEGPFDGVLAFSLGACLAAMYIIHKGLQGSQPFKCAVFFSTIKVHDPTAFERKGVVMPLIPAEAGQLIRIPTVHIWGEKDPGHRDSEDLKMLCDQQQATAVIHSGGHEVPGLGKSSEVSGIVNAVRRAIFLSSLSAV